MNLESIYKAKLVEAIKKRGGYARRHEDRYALGLLDLSIKFPSHPHLLAEAKIVRHLAFKPTLRQWKEGNDYQAAGGLCALIGWRPKTKLMFIHAWAKEASTETAWPPGGSDKDHAETLEEWLGTVAR